MVTRPAAVLTRPIVSASSGPGAQKVDPVGPGAQLRVASIVAGGRASGINCRSCRPARPGISREILTSSQRVARGAMDPRGRAGSQPPGKPGKSYRGGGGRRIKAPFFAASSKFPGKTRGEEAEGGGGPGRFFAARPKLGLARGPAPPYPRIRTQGGGLI